MTDLSEIVAMEKVAMLGILCLLTASLTMCIWKFMTRGMIFRRYYLLLIYYWIKWHKKKNRWKRKWLKPIGLCYYCYGTWINIVSFVIFIGLGSIDMILFSIALNYIFIELLNKLLKIKQ